MDKKQCIKTFDEHKCCVIIPTYNNAATLRKVVEDVLEYCKDVYVVNDGSTDNTPKIIQSFESSVRTISYPKNKGKGKAMALGMKKAFAEGFLYAVTIDSDGQHYAKNLPDFIEKLIAAGPSVIIGSRFLADKDMSEGSSFANKFSNFWFRVETGINLPDTQSGYRLYPLEPISKMTFYSGKYEFEIEIIVRLAWQAYKVLSVPIDVYYPKREERVSHFRPFKDFFRISLLNTVLVFLALAFFLPRNIVRKYKNKKIKDIIKDDLLWGSTPTHIIALSIGFGVFMGIVPIWGYQLAVGFLLAHLLKLNKSIFFIFANISLPPMIPFILYLSYVVGGVILKSEGPIPVIKDISLSDLSLKQYIVGSMALALMAGTVFALVSFVLIFIYKKGVRKK